MYNEELATTILQKLDEMFPQQMHLGELQTSLQEFSQVSEEDWLVAIDALFKRAWVQGKGIRSGMDNVLRNVAGLEITETGREQLHGQRERPHTVNIYNVQGANSRVNIQSHDQSVNISSITEVELFSGIRQAITEGVPDNSERVMILEKLSALEKSSHSGGFVSHYQAFINAVASHMTIILPFIPALTQLLR
jgi:hypothetical protein